MAIAEKTIKDRFRTLDSLRQSKIDRARKCSELTVPSLLPPEGWNEEMSLYTPYSSVASRGVTSMASRILSALLPLNDTPFFRFELKTGIQPTLEILEFLENVSYQVYNKLSSKNLRETLFLALQHLIVVGDCLLIQEDSLNFRVLRLDQYVVRRTVDGDIQEIIHLEYLSKGNDQNAQEYYTTSIDDRSRKGYDTIYCRMTKEEGDDVWKVVKENEEGNVVDTGEFTVSPYIPLRWSAVAGENYGRSHCEDILGDIQALESYTEAGMEGMAAGSAFWIGIDPAGLTEIDDVALAQNGSFVPARQNDVFTITPSGQMNSQIQSSQTAIEMMRKELGIAFLMDSASMPTGDRVTATAVRTIGRELEHVLGGAFSAIARQLMKPIVQRTILLMLDAEEIDPKLENAFEDEGGLLSIEIVTGLLALSRESDLTKLMQMGEMVRNLPPEAMALFKWDAYNRALITALGFDPSNWVKSEEEAKQEQMELAAIQGQMANEQQLQQQAGSAAVDTAAMAAQQDIAETGGQNIMPAMEEMGMM
jgi:hypothetical protein